MNLTLLNKILSGQPKYRQTQARRAVFVDLIDNWDLATVLPKDLRARLNDSCPLAINGQSQASKEKNTDKVLITLEDGLKIETVLMKHTADRRTVCVSSQVGCPMNCAFCATGRMGFQRNLTAEEIIEQVLFFARNLKNQPQPEKITNIVFMGMGEPFLNYVNVLDAIKILHDPDGFNLGARHFSISTCGVIDGINRLASEKLQINLAISLHASNDELRDRLMPINHTAPLRKLFTAVDNYIARTSRRVMFEYMLIDGINDGPDSARKLAELMAKPLYLVNLITYNPTSRFKPSKREAVEKFMNILQGNGVAVTRRYGFGQDIKAACGQLAGKK